MGGSAGGLLMGAVANLSPQDYRGIVAQVPFVDVVTTMLDDSIPLTTNEYDEWGNPNEREYYDYMLSYSPYDNVRAQAYPAMFVTTGLWDSQVQYYEPAKWVAKLRALKTDSNRCCCMSTWKPVTAASPGASSAIGRSRWNTPSCWTSWACADKKKAPRAGGGSLNRGARGDPMILGNLSLERRPPVPRRYAGRGRKSGGKPVRPRPCGHRFLRAQTGRRRGEPAAWLRGCPRQPTTQ